LAQYRKPIDDGRVISDLVSVCIPARNEEANIEACVRGILASTHSNVEVLVYDDQSTDRTPAILAKLAAEDSRVRIVPTKTLPDGWNGKQHACWRMAQDAQGTWLCFTDADVRFEPGAVRAALLAAKAGTRETGAAGKEIGLVSTFPRQETGSLAESLAVPMIFFILFSYLPFVRMRNSLDASASAGCGQFLFARKDAYFASGGHEAFKNSMHDGVKMPRCVRRAGFATDLFDGTDVVSCRMYRDLSSTWRGFAKNAYEGLGSVGLLVFVTVVHLLAHVLPFVIWPLMFSYRVMPIVALLAGVAIAAGLTQRLILAERLRTSIIGAMLHPIGVVMMTLIQWHSLLLHMTGKRTWRGRGGGMQPVAG
ncbi:MAG: glycosyltransferase, partial [Phycisphaerales bacterium]